MPSTATASRILHPGLEVPERYGDWLAEYWAAREGVALVDRRHRGWVELRGDHRARWLDNLLTNRVLHLYPGEGGYAFATNVKGRVIFDLYYLVDAEAIWLDIDRRRLMAALEHLDHHILTEEVTLADRTHDLARLALCGPGVGPLLAGLGLPHASAMEIGQHNRFQLAGLDALAFRSDFAGPIGIELVVPRDEGEAAWDALIGAGRDHGIAPVGWRALQALRIERGVPWSCEDIDEQVIPPETGCITDGISYSKGSYVGYEVIERMRSRGAVARRLVGLKIDGSAVPSPGDEIHVAGAKKGRISSACYSPALEAPLALGYLAPAHAEPGTRLQIAHERASLQARIVELPLGP